MLKKVLIGTGIAASLTAMFFLGSLTLGPVFAQTNSALPAKTTVQAQSDEQDNVDEQQPLGEAKITLDQAKATVVDQYPGASITQVDLENENGALVYGIEIKTVDGKSLDVKVDASNGNVTKTEAEDASSSSEVSGQNEQDIED